MYLSFLIVLVLGQLFVTLLLLINRKKIEDSLDKDVDQIIIQYGDSRDRQHRLIDNVQRNGKCCGRTGPRDWLQNSFIQRLNLTSPDVLPCSCFSSGHPTINSSWCSEMLFTEPLFGQGNSSYDQGCKKKFMDWLQGNALTIIGMDVSLMLIQVVQFVLGVYLYRAFGQKAALKRTNPLVDPDHADPAPHNDYGEQNYAYMDPNFDYIDPAHPAYYHDNPNHGDPTNLAYH
ncbi:hypothetical protein PAMA_015735 [Pampus argenteus]